MLIYLDTSHLVLLTETRVRDPSRFRVFAERWRGEGCTLVVTLYHFIELRQHPDRKVRLQRYETLEELLPIRTDLNPKRSASKRFSLVDREILLSPFTMGALTAEGEGAEEWLAGFIDPFHHSLSSRQDLRAVKAVLEFPFLGWIIRRMQEANELAADAQRRPSSENFEASPRLAELPDEPISREQVAEYLSAFDNFKWPLWFAACRLIAPSLFATIQQQTLGPIKKFIERAGEVGARSAYAEFIGVEVPNRNRKRLNQLAREKLLADRVRESALGGTSFGEQLASIIKLEHCPGMWLKAAIEDEIARAEASPDASNAYDLEHLAYLPYVDILTTDARIANYTRQVLRRGGLPAKLEGQHPPITARKDPDALWEAISSAINELRK